MRGNICTLLKIITYTGVLAFAISLNSFAENDTTEIFHYGLYDDILKKYVDEGSMVNYKELKSNRETLDAFIQNIGNLSSESFEVWSDEEKIAFWVNAYNALTLKVIIDNYPIKSSLFKSFRLPKNSIRQISGVWDKITFNVMGRDMTLDDIEHERLRKDFNEPRIHLALVCASMGCPPLRREPFIGDSLSFQLDDQTRQFLSNSATFRIDRTWNRVYLSPIFKWFRKDFTENYGTQNKFREHSKSNRAVLNFLSSYLDERDQNFLLNEEYEIEYLKYDWSLNEQ